MRRFFFPPALALAGACLAHALPVMLALLPRASHAAAYSVYGVASASSSLQYNHQLPEFGSIAVNSFRFTDEPQAAQPNALEALSSVSNTGAGKAMFLGSIGGPT